VTTAATLLRPLIGLSLLSLTCCASPALDQSPSVDPPPPEPKPMPMPIPTPTPAPTKAPTPATQLTQLIHAEPENWLDAPVTKGDWVYRVTGVGSQAIFADAGSGPRLAIRCDRTQGQVFIARAGNASEPVAMRILTETTTRLATAAPDLALAPNLVASVDAADPLLDAMAISKGRIAVETAGLATLYLPSWPEITKVIEDCR